MPDHGERFERSSGEATEKGARKKAGEWEAELRAGGGQKVSHSWEAFRAAYEETKVFGLRVRTAEKITSVLNIVEAVMKPDIVRRINPLVALDIPEAASRVGRLRPPWRLLPAPESRAELGQGSEPDSARPEVPEAEQGPEREGDEGAGRSPRRNSSECWGPSSGLCCGSRRRFPICERPALRSRPNRSGF